MRDVRNARFGAVLTGGDTIITKEELFEIFSGVAENDERTFGDRLKSAEFLMKYCFCGGGDEKKDGGVVIIDDIGAKLGGGNEGY